MITESRLTHPTVRTPPVYSFDGHDHDTDNNKQNQHEHHRSPSMLSNRISLRTLKLNTAVRTIRRDLTFEGWVGIGESYAAMAAVTFAPFCGRQ